VAAYEAGDYPRAEAIFLSLAAQFPRLHDAWNALCLIALQGAAPEIALEHARRAVELDRRNAEYLNNLGIASAELGEWTAAEQAFRRALKTKPAHVEAHFNLAKVLQKQGRAAESLKEFERAHALDPASARTQQGLADACYEQGQADRALAVLRAGGAAEAPGVLTHRFAMCLADVEGPQAALAWLRGCLAREPGGRYTHGPLGEIALSVGAWREGWRHYCLFYRERRAPGSIPEFTPLPARLDGRTVLVREEQGVGDILFFLRFAKLLVERGAKTIIDCAPRIAALLGPDFTLAGEGIEPDYEVATTDLPALLETDAMPPALALHIDRGARQRARDLLAGMGPAPYLGVTWRAGTDMLRRPEFGAGRAVLSKEVPLELLGQALRGWPGTVIGLQRGAAASEVHALGAAAGAPVRELSLPDEDLAQAAAVLEALKDYVAVSNTNMHLLAGLNRPARVLVPHPPFWRWMRAGTSPWFPGFSVYRQAPGGDWSEPLRRLREDLRT
jgi:tetratricopeptide (TPR) repeat protein